MAQVAGSGMPPPVPFVANPVKTAPPSVVQFGLSESWQTPMCAATENPLAFGVSTLLSVSHAVPPVLTSVNEITCDLSPQLSDELNVWLKLPNPSSFPAPPPTMVPVPSFVRPVKVHDEAFTFTLIVFVLA